MSRLSLITLFILFAGYASCQNNMKPEETEVWEPVPAKVEPGNNNKPPADAIILLGDDWSEWVGIGGAENNWKNSDTHEVKWELEDGVATVKPGSRHIMTRKDFGSVQLHIEWRSPPVTEAKGQGLGNSGIFLMRLYEVQVLDSYSSSTYPNGQAGSIYKQSIPLVNASRPPMEWQTYDIVFDAPEFDGNKLSKPAYITVFHNGVLIQNHVELKGPTVFIGHPEYKAHPEKLPILLQDHGNGVSYRNIWVREL